MDKRKQDVALNKSITRLFFDRFILLYLLVSIVVALAMYFSAPRGYDYTYSLVCFFIFASNSLIFLKVQVERVGLLNFHLFFFISFFFMKIIYLVYVYPIDPEYFFIFQFGFNEDVLCKSLIISTIASLSYILSVYCCSTGTGKLDFTNAFSSIVISKTKIRLILLVTTICFILFILVRGVSSFFVSYEESVESIGEAAEGGLLSPIVSLFQIMVFVLITYNFIKIKQEYTTLRNAFKANKATIILLSILLFLYLISGSRSLLVKILLSVGCLYSIYIKRISGLLFFITFILGFFLLGILSRTRAADDKLGAVTNFTESSSAIDIAMDLIIVNRNVFLAIDEVERNGYSYGLKASKAFFSFFPYYPVVAGNLGLKQSDIESESFFQEETNIPYSPGSSIIGDLYMILGLPSVILGMILLGYFVSKAEQKANSSLYWMYVYIILLGASLLYPRFGYFFLSRFMIWGIVIIFLIEHSNFRIKQFEN